MRRLCLILVSLSLPLALPQASPASPYDYAYGSIARYEEEGLARGRSTSLSGPTVRQPDFSNLFSEIHKIYSPPRIYSPQLPTGSGSWGQFWNNYQAPVSTYRPEPPDTRSPERKLIDAANQGDTQAMWNLGHHYFFGGLGVVKDNDRALYWLERAARAGNAEAATYLSSVLSPDLVTGTQVPKDPIKALYWLQIGAKGGDPEGMRWLGQRYLQGKGVDKNPEEGLRLLKAASDQGNTGATIYLMYAYRDGLEVPKDLNEAIRLERSLKGTGAFSRTELAAMLLEANDPKTNSSAEEVNTLLDEATQDDEVLWLRASIAEKGLLGHRDPAAANGYYTEILRRNVAGENLTKARAMLGLKYATGEGFPQDKKRGLELLKQALADRSTELPPEAGLKLAELLGASTSQEDHRQAVGLYCELGGRTDTPKDTRVSAYLEAARLVGAEPALAQQPGEPGVDELVSKATSVDSNCYLLCAIGYRNGWWGPADNKKAISKAAMAAALGLPHGYFLCGRWMFEDSGGKNELWKDAISNAVMKQDWDAYLWLADISLRGVGIARNPSAAQELLKLAAETGNNSEAANNLGLMLCRGDAGAKDISQGIKWLRKALEGGYWQAGINLARMYHVGSGVPADETMAEEFLETAAKIGGPTGMEAVMHAYEAGEVIAKSPDAAAKWKLRLGSQ